MTETQSKSGTAETVGKAADSASEGAASDGAAADATGRAVVGRAAVPGEKSDSPASDADSGKSTAPGASAVPKFTRAPGMAPPPDALVPSQSSDKGDAGAPGDATQVGPSMGATVARASVRGAAAVGARGPAVSTQPLGVGVGARPGISAPGAPAGPGPSGPASRVSEAIRTARATGTAAASRGPRRARLYLKRVDPWSVMKFSFAVSFVLFIIGVVATAVLYMALDTMGAVGTVNKALSEMVGPTAGGG